MKDGAKYFQLFGLLKNEINRGIYQSGQKIPGENELAEKYGMSRQTVRQALSLLEQESLIERRQDGNVPGTWALWPLISANTSSPLF